MSNNVSDSPLLSAKTVNCFVNKISTLLVTYAIKICRQKRRKEPKTSNKPYTLNLFNVPSEVPEAAGGCTAEPAARAKRQKFDSEVL